MKERPWSMKSTQTWKQKKRTNMRKMRRYASNEGIHVVIKDNALTIECIDERRLKIGKNKGEYCGNWIQEIDQLYSQNY